MRAARTAGRCYEKSNAAQWLERAYKQRDGGLARAGICAQRRARAAERRPSLPARLGRLNEVEWLLGQMLAPTSASA
jgi:hypothetical protein